MLHISHTLLYIQITSLFIIIIIIRQVLARFNYIPLFKKHNHFCLRCMSPGIIQLLNALNKTKKFLVEHVVAYALLHAHHNQMFVFFVGHCCSYKHSKFE